MSEARASASPRLSPKEGAGKQQAAQWACTICRARKVKCDRILPNCTSCSKNPDGCRYEALRKRVVRRSTYKDMVERLAKMESVVKDFSKSKVSPPPSNYLEAEPNSDIASVSGGTSPSPLLELVFENDECVRPVAAQVTVNGPSTLTGLQSPINHNEATLVDNDLEVEYTGPSFIFSLHGIRWINELVGDDCFGRAVASLTPTSQSHNRGNMGISPIHPLPSKSVTIDCANDYLVVINRDIRLFDGQEIMDGVERYYSTGISPSRSWFAAINIILGHVIGKRSGMENSVECEKYIGNAMSMIPSIMMSKPNQLSVGAMLSMTAYFLFLCENQTAIMILAVAIQSMVLSGYDSPRRRPGQSNEDKLRERRLFWQAFVFDHNLALQVGKPPMIGHDFIIDLRDDLPNDGGGTVTFDNGVTLDILREHVSLALIKRKVYSLLYAKDTVMKRDHEVVKLISDLDFELYNWKIRIPEITKSDRPPEQDEKDSGLICLTMLHYTYYQLIIVIHSFIFQCSNLIESDDNFENILSSVALCVGAARATVSLLDFHEDRHPFSMHLLNNVYWSLDIIFINILQNKGTVGAGEDLNLLGRIISLFKKYYPNYTHSVSFRIAKVFYQVAWKALQNHAFYQTPPPNNVPPPADIHLYKAWNRHTQSKIVPHNTSASNPLESSTQAPFYNQPTTTQSALPSHQQGMTAPFNLPMNEQFHDLGLDYNTSNNMDWSDKDHSGPNTEWRLSLGLEPQYWQGLLTTAALPEEEEWEGNTN